MNRIVALVAALILFAAACGVERSSDDTLAEDATPSPSEGDAEADGDDDDDGSDGQAEGDDGATATTSPPTGTTPTTGAPGDVALSADFGDSQWEITHGELNEVVVPTQENPEFVTRVFGGTPPPNFAAGVLTEALVSEALQRELAKLGASIDDDDLAASRQLLLVQVQQLFPGEADPAAAAEQLYDDVPYLPFLAEYQAGQEVLSAALADAANPSSDGIPCVRHILVETEAEGDDILTRLDDGDDFSELAQELSTGPSGPTGGDLGCAPASNYVPEFAAAVVTADLGTFVGPVQTEFGWHVIVVDRYEVDGRELAGELIRARLADASVDVDAALGTWDGARFIIIPPGS